MQKSRLLSAVLLFTAGSLAFAQNVTGAGATFPYPIYSKWFSEYSAAHPDVKINYQSIGSGAGIRQVTAGTVDFGAADVPMTDEQLAASKVKIVHIPTVLGAVVPVFNVKGVKDLKIGPDVLADIYLGKITNWNDSRLAKDNPGVSLPNEPVFIVHRADVELIYALQNNINYGWVQNSSGNWLKATTEGVSAAAAGAKIPADYRVSITNAPGKDAYPISSFTWLLIPNPPKDATNGKAIKDFLGWMLDKGESETTALHYAPLPDSVVTRVRATIAQLK
jgi:phosphate transport system substrate-binding protein